MADAGLRLVVEGEKEFKKALADIDQQLKTNKKELQLLVEQYKVNDDGLGNLTERQKVLADSIDAQKQKVKLLSDQYAEAATVYDENDKRLVTLKNSMLDAETSLAKMTAQQQELTKMQEDAQYATAEYDKTIEQLRATVEANTSEIKAMDTAAGKLGDSTDDLKEKNANLSKQNDVLRKSQEAQRAVVDNLNAEYQVTVKRYGEGSTEAEKYRKKVLDATAELDRMGDQLEENEQAIRDNSKAMEEGGDASQVMLDNFGQISSVIGVEIPGGLTKIIEDLGTGAVKLGTIAGAAKTIADIAKSIVEDTTEQVKNIDTLSAQLGMNTTDTQRLQYAAEKLHVEMDVVLDVYKEINNKAGDTAQKLAEYAEEEAKAEEKKIAEKEKLEKEYYENIPKWADHQNEDLFKIMQEYDAEYAKNVAKVEEDYQKTLDGIRDKSAEATKVWDDIGVAIFDTNGEIKTAQELFEETIDAFHGMEDGIERNKKMIDLVGESYQKFVPFVKAGTDQLQEFYNEADEVYVVMDEQLDELRKNTQAWEDYSHSVKNSLQAIKDDIMAPKNAIKEFFGSIKDAFASLGNGNWTWGTVGPRTYATGTYNHPGGLAMVGENGPEIVELPRGSKVYPNGTAPAGMGGNTTFNITIPAKDIREFNDIVDIVQNAAVGFRRG